MPILVDFVFQFLRLRTYKSSITLLFISNVLERVDSLHLQSYIYSLIFSYVQVTFPILDMKIDCRMMFVWGILIKMGITFCCIKSTIG
ncbi:hypothetical protein HMPREF9999_01143 [Alloprevotella sp. oral taxon 473 str. F0040]|nr:hypothetical protein HMPREF9999_01143 [Alloprevotella sp. oral taxon 473 str. F0040]